MGFENPFKKNAPSRAEFNQQEKKAMKAKAMAKKYPGRVEVFETSNEYGTMGGVREKYIPSTDEKKSDKESNRLYKMVGKAEAEAHRWDKKLEKMIAKGASDEEIEEFKKEFLNVPHARRQEILRWFEEERQKYEKMKADNVVGQSRLSSIKTIGALVEDLEELDEGEG